MKYPSFKPYLDQNSKEFLINCLKENAISGNFGSYIKKVEDEYSKLHGKYYGVICSSGTSALHLACLSLGIRKKHTVVVPASTNMATFFAPMYIGAKVLSCDVNKKNGLIDLDELKRICLRQKVDYVIIVHLYGHIVNTSKLLNLQKLFKFKVIEDCAEAHFGKDEKNSFVGSNFDAGCFSFYVNKIISGGEGGLVLFKNKKDSDKARNLKNLAFGDSSSRSKFFHNVIGFNYRLNNLSASLIWQSLQNRIEILQQRKEIEFLYTSILKNKNYIELIPSTLNSYSVNWVYCIKFKDSYLSKFKNKNIFLKELSKKGLEARDFFYPADHQTFFKNYAKERNYKFKKTKQSLEFYRSSIYLPVYLNLNKEDIKKIILIIEQVIL